MLIPQNDEHYMRRAYREAEAAYEEGEVPVGAVIVCQGRVIARGRNQTERLTDVTAHAEILALTAASEYLGSKYLTDCTLYVTLEPCVMCAGALAWAQLPRLVYGASDPKRGYAHTGGDTLLHPKTTITHGVLAEECGRLLTAFFRAKR